MQRVEGICPMGCGETLTLLGTEIYCSNPQCPEPTAVHQLLITQVIDHIVAISPMDFSIVHPLRERMGTGADLLLCRLQEDLSAMGGPPAPPGIYTAIREQDPDGNLGWGFTWISELPTAPPDPHALNNTPL